MDDFTLVSAFFLFVLGCMNMLLGLIFRESAKSRRSVTSWREEAKGILPTTNVGHLALNRTGSSESSRSFTSSTLYEEKSRDLAEFGAGRSNSRAGYGFGRQGEKAAGLKGQSSWFQFCDTYSLYFSGFLISKPLETVPRYSPRPTSVPSQSSRVPSPEPRFASSGTAI